MFTTSTRQFHYYKDICMFEGEISSLPGFYLDRVLEGSIEWLSATEGFTLISEKTGHAKKLFLDQTCYDRENDITHWVFRPIENGRPEEPSTFTLVLYND